MIVLLLAPSLLGGKVLSSSDTALFQGPFAGERPASLTRPGNSELDDPMLVFQPDLIVFRRALEDGQLGLWNPDQQGGRPLLASQQTAPLFPLTWLALIRSFWRALAWIAALKLLAAAFGAYMLGRWSGLRRGPATLVGTAYGFCTYINSGLQFPLSGVMAMTPWTMLMAGRVGRYGRTLDALGLALAVGLTMLTGSPELIAIAFGGVVVYAAYELFSAHAMEGERQVGRWRRLALLVGCGVAGVTLSAAALVPFAEFLGLANTTSRGGVGIYPNSIVYAFFFPELWGRPDKAMGQFGPINYTERTAYLGALPLLLAVGGLFARRPRREHLFWALFAAATFLIAMHTFLHDFVGGLPGPDHVNMLRTLLLVELSGALLAGLGLQSWLDAGGSERRRMMAAMVIAVLLPVAFLLRDTDPFSHLLGSLGQLPSLGREAVTEKSFIKQIVAWRWLVFGGLGLCLLALSRHIPRRLALALIVGLVATDLLTMDAGYNPQIPLAEATPPTPPALGYVQSHIGHQRMSGTLNSTSVDLQANLAERYALPDVGSYNFPKTSRWAALWGAYGQSTGDQNDWNPELPASHAVLDAFSVKYVLPPAGTRGPAWLKPVYDQSAGRPAGLGKPDRATPRLGGLRLAHGVRSSPRRYRDRRFEHQHASQPARARRGGSATSFRIPTSSRRGEIPSGSERTRLAARRCSASGLPRARRFLLPGLAGHRRRSRRQGRGGKRELPCCCSDTRCAHDRLSLPAFFVPDRGDRQHPHGCWLTRCFDADVPSSPPRCELRLTFCAH